MIGCIVGTPKLLAVISIMDLRRCSSCSSQIVAIAKRMLSWRQCFQIQRSDNDTKTEIVLMGEWRNDCSFYAMTMARIDMVS